MRKWGKNDTHCYCLGVYDKKHQALKEAEQEEIDRGGTKYEAEILEFDLNDSNSVKYIKICFKLRELRECSKKNDSQTGLYM